MNWDDLSRDEKIQSLRQDVLAIISTLNKLSRQIADQSNAMKDIEQRIRQLERQSDRAPGRGLFRV